MAGNSTNKLLLAILSGITAGIIIGGTIPEIGQSIQFLGELFLKALFVMVVPLVISSMIVGISSLGDIRQLGPLGTRTVLFFMITTGIAVIIGLLLVLAIHPGGQENVIANSDLSNVSKTLKNAPSTISDLLEKHGLKERIPLAALAKKEETLYRPNKDPLILDRRGRLLVFARDEAHRFVNNFHRKRRGKSTLHDPLEEIEGLGAKKLQALGAKVKEVSIPMHLLGSALWLPIGIEGLTQTMMHGDGYGLSRPDLYVTSLMDKHRGWRQRADEMSVTTKLMTMLGTYINKQHGSRYYGKAMNLTRLLTAAYDSVLADYDLLLMPTTPVKSTPLPGTDASHEEYVQRALEMISNTAPFDITHHPAMAIPCGMSKGLPVSMMLVGKHFEESTIYRAAHAFEQGAKWKSM